jgi:hypothetical protein
MGIQLLQLLILRANPLVINRQFEGRYQRFGETCNLYPQGKIELADFFEILENLFTRLLGVMSQKTIRVTLTAARTSDFILFYKSFLLRLRRFYIPNGHSVAESESVWQADGFAEVQQKLRGVNTEHQTA